MVKERKLVTAAQDRRTVAQGALNLDDWLGVSIIRLGNGIEFAEIIELTTVAQREEQRPPQARWMSSEAAISRRGKCLTASDRVTRRSIPPEVPLSPNLVRFVRYGNSSVR